MGTLSFDFWMYGSHYSHTAWWKSIFIENCCFCKRIKPKIICNPDLVFGLAEHLVTLTLYTALPLYHLEEICHPDLIFWPALLFGTWEYQCWLCTNWDLSNKFQWNFLQITKPYFHKMHIESLMQDCSISIALIWKYPIWNASHFIQTLTYWGQVKTHICVSKLPIIDLDDGQCCPEYF